MFEKRVDHNEASQHQQPSPAREGVAVETRGSAALLHEEKLLIRLNGVGWFGPGI